VAWEWITEADARRSLASVRRLANTASLPTSAVALLADAMEEARLYIRRVLAGRGIPVAVQDRWDERRSYNRRIGLCIYFEQGGLPEDYNGFSLDRVCKAREELLTCDVLVNGEVYTPDGTTGANVGYGDSVDDDPPGSITRDTVL
jgi:hypothetical protein